MRKIEKVNAVLFDMDGLLLDTEKLLIKYWCIAAQEKGYNMQKHHALFIRSLAGKWAAPYLRQQLGADFDYQSVRERRKELMNAEIVANGLDIKEGAFELLEELQKRGLKRCVVTATDYERAKWYLTQAGLFDKFDKIICAPMVENGKPAPDVYLYACEQIGENPQDCIALEDSPNGVCSASEAGCNTIMVPDLTDPTPDDMKKVCAVAANLRQVIRFLPEA